MEKLQNGSTDCDRQSGLSKFRIKIRPKVNELSIETKEDQKQQPNPSGVSAVRMEELQNGGNDCDRQSRLFRFGIKIRTKVKGSSLGTKEDPERQPEVKKASEETKDEQEQHRIIGNTEIYKEMKKTGALDDEERENFRLNEAESKEKRKRGFTLALSREQIEEDILELLGSMPPRRKPKKRARASQLRLNNLFPAIEELFVMKILRWNAAHCYSFIRLPALLILLEGKLLFWIYCLSVKILFSTVYFFVKPFWIYCLSVFTSVYFFV